MQIKKTAQYCFVVFTCITWQRCANICVRWLRQQTEDNKWNKFSKHLELQTKLRNLQTWCCVRSCNTIEMAYFLYICAMLRKMYILCSLLFTWSGLNIFAITRVIVKKILKLHKCFISNFTNKQWHCCPYFAHMVQQWQLRQN